MRMAGPDYALFAVGLVLFGGAVYGLVSYEGNAASATGLFSVSWTPKEVAAGAQKSFGASGTEFSFDVTQRNAAVVAVKISCATPLTGPAAPTVQVRLAGPGGLSGERSEACGQDFTVEVAANPQPTATSASGSSADNARENLYNSQFPSPKGIGAWTATITVSGGAPGALPVGAPAGTAQGVVKLYDAVLTPQPK